MTHDYTRDGTITVFAAVVQLADKLMPAPRRAKRTSNGYAFSSRLIARPRPPSICNATHKHPKVRAWLDEHPRFNMRFTPTSSSWLNLVERFFANLTGDVIRARSFALVNDLVRNIATYLAERNANPKPYKWKAKGDEIISKIKQTCAAPRQSRGRMSYLMVVANHKVRRED